MCYHCYTTASQDTWYRLAARIAGNTISVCRDGQPLPGLQNIRMVDLRVAKCGAMTGRSSP